MTIDRNKIYTELCEKIGNDKFTGILFDFLINKELIKEFIDYLESREINVKCPDCKSEDTYVSELQSGKTYRCNSCGIYF